MEAAQFRARGIGLSLTKKVQWISVYVALAFLRCHHVASCAMLNQAAIPSITHHFAASPKKGGNSGPDTFGPAAGHDESAQCHAILWSLIASAQRHEIDVQFYLRSVLANLPGLPPEELPNYLPDAWKRDLMAAQRAKLSAHHAALDRAIIR
jgi:hypothetical protein